MRVIIGADIVPTLSNMTYFEDGRADLLCDKYLCDLLSSSDYNIFNLETPLCDVSTPIDKCGPCLSATTKSINGYKALHINLLTLANNHIMDHGVAGLNSTLSVLKNNGISYIGIGDDATTASAPVIQVINNKKIGIYACVEHEFSAVSASQKGANAYDPLESFDHVQTLKNECDYVIVLFHGGKEHFRYPSPNLQRICHKFVEKGANIVLCQHSHCIGCKEDYHQSTIIYGQGNFLFDGSESEFWKTGLLVCINENFKIDYIPIIKDQHSVKIAHGEEKNTILKEFYKRSEEIREDGFVEENYSRFSKASYYECMLRISGLNYSLLCKVLNKITMGKFLKVIIDHRYGKKKRIVLKNTIECEAWAELLAHGLNGRIKND